ncbi:MULTISPECIES: SIR2 family protein [Bradyrhizobium]|nr:MULTISPECIES: SIR2 family protein [Bradyrhizobium]KIU51979.1 Sir2 family NAD-dependent protein deacetylase [Bradyrhizobium elkanii]OCX32755.1 Sir2 family NAD-dependent protein deacetylase [Bradyrhizobium sp. UASWS1016]
MSVSWDGGRKCGPSWSAMVDQAAILLGCTDANLLRMRGSDLQILEYFKILKNDLAPLTNWLALQFFEASDDDILASPIHSELVQLQRCSFFYTTNYDDFIERALTKSGRAAHIVSGEHTIAHDRSLVEVVKFHGDFNNPKEMVVSESQYMERMRLESPMDFKLRADILGRAVLFIGYSFRDPNVNYVFHIVNRLFANLPHSPTGRRAYIILPEPSEFERRLFNERNIDVIPVAADNIAANVAAVLREMRS